MFKIDYRTKRTLASAGIYHYRDLVGRVGGVDRFNQLTRDGTYFHGYGPWFVDRQLPGDAYRVLKSKSRIGCLTACSLYGIWVPRQDKLHACIGVGDKRPSGEDMYFHRIAQRGAVPLSMPDEALEEVARFHHAETGLIVAESALQKGIISYESVLALMSTLPKGKQRIWRHFDFGAQSGSETRVRLYLQRKRVKVESQVQIQGVGRVDLLVGNSLIIECDSQSYHSSAEAGHRDRTRDIAAHLLGYRVVRLSYWQIWREWETTSGLLDRIIASGRHLAKPRPLG